MKRCWSVAVLVAMLGCTTVAWADIPVPRNGETFGRPASPVMDCLPYVIGGMLVAATLGVGGGWLAWRMYAGARPVPPLNTNAPKKPKSEFPS